MTVVPGGRPHDLQLADSTTPGVPPGAGAPLVPVSGGRTRSIPLAEVLTSYINEVLRHRRDEATIMGPPTETMSLPVITGMTPVMMKDEDVDWRDLV